MLLIHTNLTYILKFFSVIDTSTRAIKLSINIRNMFCLVVLLYLNQKPV